MALEAALDEGDERLPGSRQGCPGSRGQAGAHRRTYRPGVRARNVHRVLAAGSTPVMPRFLQQALQDQLPRTGSAARAQTSPRRRVRVQAMGAPGPIHATCAGASGANERPRPFPRAGALFASEHRPWSSPLPRPGHGRVDILRRRGHDKTALKRLYDRRAAVERAKRCHLARALSHGRRTQLHQGLRSPLERGVLRQGGRDPRARVEPREAHHTSPRAATLRPSWTLGLSRS